MNTKAISPNHYPAALALAVISTAPTLASARPEPAPDRNTIQITLNVIGDPSPLPITVRPHYAFPDDAVCPPVVIDAPPGRSFSIRMPSEPVCMVMLDIFLDDLDTDFHGLSPVPKNTELHAGYALSYDPVFYPSDGEAIEIGLHLEPSVDTRVILNNSDGQAAPGAIWSGASGPMVYRPGTFRRSPREVPPPGDNRWSVQLPGITASSALDLWCHVPSDPSFRWRCAWGDARMYLPHQIPSSDLVLGSQTVSTITPEPQGVDKVKVDLSFSIYVPGGTRSSDPEDAEPWSKMTKSDYFWFLDPYQSTILFISAERDFLVTVPVQSALDGGVDLFSASGDGVPDHATVLSLETPVIIPPGTYDVLLGSFEAFDPQTLAKFLESPGVFRSPTAHVPRITIPDSDSPVAADLGTFSIYMQRLTLPLSVWRNHDFGPDHIPGAIWEPRFTLTPIADDGEPLP